MFSIDAVVCWHCFVSCQLAKQGQSVHHTDEHLVPENSINEFALIKVKNWKWKRNQSARPKSAHRTKKACLIIIFAILFVLVISICHQWSHKAITVSQMSLSVSTKAPRKEVQSHCPLPPHPPFASQWSSLSQPREPNIAGGNPCHASDDYEIFYICKTLPEEQRTQDIES